MYIIFLIFSYEYRKQEYCLLEIYDLKMSQSTLIAYKWYEIK